jgi:hypothetical protein
MTKDKFTGDWILANALPILDRYAAGVLTVRGLYYQLVNIGLTNSQRHYKRVVGTMIKARRAGLVPYGSFTDRDRAMESETLWSRTDVDSEVEKAKRQIGLWMCNYYKNRWENQIYYPEVLIEKKALVGTFENVCKRNRVGLGACKGYPSLTFLNDLADRMKAADNEGKTPIILYFGDYDPSGEDIPRSIQDNLANDFGVDVEVRRVALMVEQVRAWNLPPAPTKLTDSRTANWDGIGQVELDAVDPGKLEDLVQGAIDEIFDEDRFAVLEDVENGESEEYVKQLKEYVKTL